MNNAYGTKKYFEYINWFLKGVEYNLNEELKCKIFDLDVTVKVYKYFGKRGDCETSLEKADVIIKRNGVVMYECVCVDCHNWNNFIFPVTVKDVNYLFFRKSLYGFTFLNTEDFSEYTFFPANVIAEVDEEKFNESFIITDVLQYKDLFIFDGCYWGAPYEFYAYHFSTKKLLSLYNAMGISSSKKMYIKNEDLVLESIANKNTVITTLTYGKLCELINKMGKCDFY